MAGKYQPTIWYVGGKFMHLDWLLPLLPTDARVYCEPFGGSGVVLANRPRAEVEIYNDLNPEPGNLFRVLPQHWAALQARLALQPYHRGDFDKCQDLAAVEDPVDRAYQYWVRTRQSKFGKGACGRATWGTNMKPDTRGPGTYVTGWWRSPARLEWIAGRMRGVVIECMDALAVMQKYDSRDTLFYVDPPYVMSGRRGSGSMYVDEMSDAAHVELLAGMKALAARWVLAGYNNQLYVESLEGYPSYTRPASVSPLTNDSSDRASGALLRKEIVWANFDTDARDNEL